MRIWRGVGVLMMSMAAGVDAGAGAQGETIKLPPPETTNGMPLMQALKARHSSREFSGRPVPLQVVSNLLWAASGVNRPETGQRTAPSAHDWREIDIYLATPEAAFRYEPETHALHRVVAGDLRALTGVQDFVAHAPLNLVYVANEARMVDASAEDRALYGAADAGFVAQNVYLYGASAGLAVVVRGVIDRPALAAGLKLAPTQRVILAQSVGYPAHGR